MALGAIEQKKDLIESRARIREFVFGIQDGLMSTVGLLTGVQGATESTAVVIITGLTAMFSGAISMAAGSYLSSSAEKDIFDKELRDAEVLAEKEPYFGCGRIAQGFESGRLGAGAELQYRQSSLAAAAGISQNFSGKSLRPRIGGNQPAPPRSIGHGGFVHGWGFCADRAVSADCRTNGFVSFDCALGCRALWGRFY